MKNAVLIFSAGFRKDLRHRGLNPRFSHFLQIPHITSDVTNDADIHLFARDESFPCRIPAHVHVQAGSSFGERLQNAIGKLVELGYQKIVIIGSDCPELLSKDIKFAIDQLSQYSLVLGPDHRGGCYLIGFQACDSSKLSEIQWQRNTDCVQLQYLFGSDHTLLLSVKHDIDSMEDVRLLARCNNKWGAEARSILQAQERTPEPVRELRLIHLSTDTQRPRWQLPPP